MHVLFRRSALIAGTAALLMGSAAAAAVAGGTHTPSLSWSPAGSYDFGSVTAGTTTQPQLFTLTNTGGSASANLTVSVGGTAFALSDDTCTGTSLGPGKSCTVTVTYTADSSSGTDTGTLTAIGQRGDTATVNLSGVSQSPATLTISTAQFTDYPCPSGYTCWGVLSGSGLAPGTPVTVYFIGPKGPGSLTFAADANGNISGSTQGFLLGCGLGVHDVYAVATTAGGATITSPAVNSPCG